MEQQQAILSRAINSKADGIFIDLLDASRLTPLLVRARAEGIQLAIFDSEAPAGLPITSVGNDYCKQAQIASERLVKLLAGRGEVAIMQGVPTAPNHAIRFRCHLEVFRRFPGIQVVATPSDQDSIATASLGAQGRVQAVGIDDVPELVGQIRSGVVNSSVATKPRAQGYWSILSLWQQTLAAPPIERIDTGITVVE